MFREVRFTNVQHRATLAGFRYIYSRELAYILSHDSLQKAEVVYNLHTILKIKIVSNMKNRLHSITAYIDGNWYNCYSFL